MRLSPAAIATLERARNLQSPAGWCFPAPTRASRQMHATTLAQALRRLHGDRCTMHGFRSSFGDWASEQTSVPDAVAEAVLAHQAGSVRRQLLLPAHCLTIHATQRVPLPHNSRYPRRGDLDRQVRA